MISILALLYFIKYFSVTNSNEETDFACPSRRKLWRGSLFRLCLIDMLRRQMQHGTNCHRTNQHQNDGSPHDKLSSECQDRVFVLLSSVVPKRVVQPRQKDQDKTDHFGKEAPETPNAKDMACLLEGEVSRVIAHTESSFGVNQHELKENRSKNTGHQAQDRRDIKYIGHNSVLVLRKTGRRPAAKRETTRGEANVRAKAGRVQSAQKLSTSNKILTFSYIRNEAFMINAVMVPYVPIPCKKRDSRDISTKAAPAPPRTP